MNGSDVANYWFMLNVEICKKDPKEQKRLVKLIRADLQKIARGEHALQWEQRENDQI